MTSEVTIPKLRLRLPPIASEEIKEQKYKSKKMLDTELGSGKWEKWSKKNEDCCNSTKILVLYFTR